MQIYQRKSNRSRVVRQITQPNNRIGHTLDGAAKTGQPARGSQHMLQLQRRYGNQYLQKTLGTQITPLTTSNGRPSNVREALQTKKTSSLVKLTPEELKKLSPNQAKNVLQSNKYKRLAIGKFDDAEMCEALDILGKKCPDWMHVLLYQLSWMYAEGVGSWARIKSRLVDYEDKKYSQHRQEVLKNDDIKRYFIKELNDAEMSEAVGILGKNQAGWSHALLYQLSWMNAEGVGSWDRIKERLTAEEYTPKQKEEVLRNKDILQYFSSELNDKRMVEATKLLGASHYWKLKWLNYKGVSGKIVYSATRKAVAGSPNNQKAALKLIADFKRDTTIAKGAFGGISKSQIVSGLDARVRNPHIINQKGLNACGPAAAVYIFAKTDPVGYVNLAISLYLYGRARYRNYTVQPGSALKSGKGLRARWPSGMKPHAVDWIVLSSLRDAENWAFSFEGLPSDAFSAMTFPGELKEWLEDLLGFRKVIDDTNLVATKTIAHLKSVNAKFGTPKYIILFINTNMFAKKTKFSAKKASGTKTAKMQAAFPTHYVVMNGMATINDTAKEVTLNVWSWGAIQPSSTTKPIPFKAFEDNYYGAIYVD